MQTAARALPVTEGLSWQVTRFTSVFGFRLKPRLWSATHHARTSVSDESLSNTFTRCFLMTITPSAAVAAAAAAATELSSFEGERENLLSRDVVEVFEERAGVTDRDEEKDIERRGGGGGACFANSS